MGPSLLRQLPSSSMEQFWLHLIGYFLVTWLYLAAREFGKCAKSQGLLLRSKGRMDAGGSGHRPWPQSVYLLTGTWRTFFAFSVSWHNFYCKPEWHLMSLCECLISWVVFEMPSNAGWYLSWSPLSMLFLLSHWVVSESFATPWTIAL